MRKSSKMKLQTPAESSSDEDYYEFVVSDPGKLATINAIGRMNNHSYHDFEQIKLGIQQK